MKKRLLFLAILEGIILIFNPPKLCAYNNKPYPIGFSIPESKIVTEIPEKTQDFSPQIPGWNRNYSYYREEDYYKDYQASYFAVTCKKGGWDCLRHYEILANGCVPYFLDLDECDDETLYFFPKDLIKEAMHLPGVSYLHIDHQVFDREKYRVIVHKLLEHTRKYLTCTAMASYLLNTIHYSGQGNILFLSYDISPDYLPCLTLIGLKQLLGAKVIDFPKIPHIYKNYENPSALYGRGMSYTRILDDLPINRALIPYRVKNKEFEVIIYGSVHRGLLFQNEVLKRYPKEKVVYLDGEDLHTHCPYQNYHNLFLREFSSITPAPSESTQN